MRDVFAWGLARVDLGAGGAVVKVSLPVINWHGAGAADFGRLCDWLGATAGDG